MLNSLQKKNKMQVHYDSSEYLSPYSAKIPRTDLSAMNRKIIRVSFSNPPDSLFRRTIRLHLKKNYKKKYLTNIL